MANQENNPTKKSKVGVVGVLSIAVAILFVLLIGLIGSTSDNSKTLTKNEIVQNKNTKTTNENKAKNKEDIADVFLISNWQFFSTPNNDIHHCSFVFQNNSNLNLTGTNIYLHIYDKDDVLIKKTLFLTNSLPSSFNSGDKVKISENFHGNLETAAWGKIVLKVLGEGGKEYSSEKWKFNFSGGKAILGNAVQTTEQSTKKNTEQSAKQNTEQLPAGSSNGNNSVATYKDSANQNINWMDYFPINRSSGKLNYLQFRNNEIELFKPSTEYKGKQIFQNKEYYLTEAKDGTQYLWEISNGLIYNKYIRYKDKEFVEKKSSGISFLSMSGLQHFGEYKIELNKTVSLNNHSYICELLSQHELPNGLVFNNVLVQKYTYTGTGNYYTETYFAKGIGIIHYRYAKIDVDNDGRKRKNFSSGFYLESHNLGG